MRYAIAALITLLAIGCLCGVPYCGATAVLVAAVAFAWEPKR